MITVTCVDCGKQQEKYPSELKKTPFKRCNICKCIRLRSQRFKHGLSGEGLYSVWGAMRRRCLNDGSQNYKYYGARGVTLCEEWTDYIAFRTWALKYGYKEGLSIERVNNNGNYEPNNCTWIKRGYQAKNRRINKLSFEKAETIRKMYALGDTRKELSIKFNVSINTIRSIVLNELWNS